MFLGQHYAQFEYFHLISPKSHMISFKFPPIFPIRDTEINPPPPLFWISKNVIYTKCYSMHKEHRADPKDTRRRKQRKNKKRKPTNKLITKRKRGKERRERITSRESPSPRPIKKSSTKRSKHLISRTIQILKSPPILFLPNAPKDAE